ncbi:hypothetical protein [Comamonas terrae]|uniref:Uncharacterized protein n=1 Tax=Comamonas terrae TaxID=673548 RepID=A0ABW5UTB6_9BURK|nr:hypothetical protein [Comamonas terrae]
MHASRTVMPSIRCTDPAFQYRNAVSTNLADTFAQARDRIAAQQAQTKKPTRSRRQQPPALANLSLPLL